MQRVDRSECEDSKRPLEKSGGLLLDDIRSDVSSPLLVNSAPPSPFRSAPHHVDLGSEVNAEEKATGVKAFLSRRRPETVEQKKAAKKKKRPEGLNWMDRENLLKNESLFDALIRYRLGIAERKRTEYPKGFDKGNYFDNLFPIIASDYVRAEKILCCMRERNGFPLPCDQWSLCSRCAYQRGLTAAGMYYKAYDKANFFHLTISFDGDIPFDVTNSVDARAYWKAAEGAVRLLIEHGLFHGAYLVHELKIRSFCPLRILPHSHVIVTADAFAPELLVALAEMIGDAAGVILKPSINVRLVDSKSSHFPTLQYLTKAIELKEPYESAFLKVGENGLPELNRLFRVFLDAQAAAFNGMNRIVRMGNLMPQRKSFIGTKLNERKEALKQAFKARSE